MATKSRTLNRTNTRNYINNRIDELETLNRVLTLDFNKGEIDPKDFDTAHAHNRGAISALQGLLYYVNEVRVVTGKRS